EHRRYSLSGRDASIQWSVEQHTDRRHHQPRTIIVGKQQQEDYGERCEGAKKAVRSSHQGSRVTMNEANHGREGRVGGRGWRSPRSGKYHWSMRSHLIVATV